MSALQHQQQPGGHLGPPVEHQPQQPGAEGHQGQPGGPNGSLPLTNRRVQYRVVFCPGAVGPAQADAERGPLLRHLQVPLALLQGTHGDGSQLLGRAKWADEADAIDWLDGQIHWVGRDVTAIYASHPVDDKHPGDSGFG